MTTDSEGLHEIANTQKEDRVADIVFVHGLGGTAHGTWRHGEVGKPNHFFWPAELGIDLPNCGIWTVGYPAGFTAIGKPGMIIEKRAGNLSQKLINAGLGVRPLLFVTHSMGGLVVKSLIVGSQILADVDRKRIASMVRGVVFCGTPHRGSAFADAAGVLGKFLGGSQDHVDEMRANAEPLDILHDQFIEWHRTHSIPVDSYAENIGLFRTRLFLRPLPLGPVVPRASANPGLAGHSVRDVDDDHLTLVKPRNRRHDVYAGVLGFIRKALEQPSTKPVVEVPAGHPKTTSTTPPGIRAAIPIGRPRVYLSYTIRTPGLRDRVMELAQRLRDNGIDVRIDVYYARSLHGFVPPDPVPDGDSWAAWQADQIRDADCVLVMCSKEFLESPEDSGAWRDVNFMKHDIAANGAQLRKFIPIGYGPFDDNKPFIPSFIRGAHYYDLNENARATLAGADFEDLIQRFRVEFPPAIAPTQLPPKTKDVKVDLDNGTRLVGNPDSLSMNKIIAFISYSHDSEAHRAKVLAFSQRLRADGIETILDQYLNGAPADGWPRWMMNALNTATHVLCVCSENYRQRFLGLPAIDKGKGSDWEGALITQALYDARSISNKFIPVLLSAPDQNHIPEPLRSKTHYLLTSEDSYQALYDGLLNQAGVEPGQVGQLKVKARPTATPMAFGGDAAAGPVAAQSPSPAVTIWREKLEFLLVEDAVCVDAAMKFRLKHLIAEAQAKIQSLGGRL